MSIKILLVGNDRHQTSVTTQHISALGSWNQGAEQEARPQVGLAGLGFSAIVSLSLRAYPQPACLVVTTRQQGSGDELSSLMGS